MEGLLQGIASLWDEAVEFRVPETGPLTETDGTTMLAEMRTPPLPLHPLHRAMPIEKRPGLR